MIGCLRAIFDGFGDGLPEENHFWFMLAFIVNIHSFRAEQKLTFELRWFSCQQDGHSGTTKSSYEIPSIATWQNQSWLAQEMK